MFDLTPFRYHRKLNIEDVPARRASDGTPLCRWCGGPLPRRRRQWCSQTCVDEYLIRSQPREVHHRVYARDHGVCSQCGIDTVLLRRLLREFEVRMREIDSEWRKRRRAALGPWAAKTGKVFWEADHIVPVNEGGGCCGLDNYRTLCVRCHKAETAALAARRALRRKDTNASHNVMAAVGDLDRHGLENN